MLKVNTSQLNVETAKQEKRSRFQNWFSYVRNSQEGNKVHLGTRDLLSKTLYSTMSPLYTWDPTSSICHSHHGGIFNMEFTQDGSLLVAACEKKSILILDPLRGSVVNYINNAHNDCVNCIRFLDSRMFATCSDDNCVSLWDIRFLKSRIRTLKGHSNWVKNIEYASGDGLLVTSGFDGSIFAWDINKYSEGDVQFKCLFHTDGLMRTKLSPDGSKLVMCTSSGYLMVIHDLDLHNLSKDLKAFKPSLYHHMQQSNTPLHVGCSYNHLFRAKRNRVELISDFPTGNDAEVISSLQIHPQGWCALSRNTSSDENSEWSCVHDIQDFPDWSAMDGSMDEEDDDDQDGDEDEDTLEEPVTELNDVDSDGTSDGSVPPDSQNNSSQTESLQPVFHIRFNCRRRAAQENNAQPANDGPRREVTASSNSSGPSGSLDLTLRISSLEALETLAATLAVVRASQRNSSQDSSEGASRMPVASVPSDQTVAGNEISDPVGESSSVSTSIGSSSGGDGEGTDGDTDNSRLDFRDRLAYLIRAGSQMSARQFLTLGASRRSGAVNAGQAVRKKVTRKIIRKRNRLTHFVAEPNVGRGFIKELCFSSDGRLVCSPFDHGVRLLAFNSNCSEMCDCIPDRPTRLYEVASHIRHPYVVVSTKFSPTHCLLVSGCLRGKICFYQPVLG